MAEFKLMKPLNEHIKHIQNSTLHGNLNTGQAIDPMRFRLDEKRKEFEFGKTKKIGYNSSNFIEQQSAPQSNYGKLK